MTSLFASRPLASYVPDMADERNKQFASDLPRMSEEEVRQQLHASVQPEPFLRAMAVTELERRRQQRSSDLLQPSFSFTRVTVGVVMLGAIIAAIWYWLFWSGYMG